MTEVPLREPAFLILTALADQPQHGYGVIEEVRRISDGQVRLQAGTLYAVLDRLREAGLIEVDREEVVQSRLRRYYKLTGLGARRLAEETVRLRRNVTVAGQRLRKLGLSGGAA
ncbi:MAG: PadR family transcriptional regulator [Actinobacteria bacterium 13_1_20CM_3_71_11]|nr:MAG: PadR family transcriptional regulator [Actinobacteria bacterium 13_1_20CM_3_71_11]TML33852.1 MAG: PadR family transcriptional regulator [Actinomycetota bacterium]